MSSGHRDLDLALKWPNIIVKDGLSPEIKLGRSSNSLNSAVDWRSKDSNDITFLTLKGHLHKTHWERNFMLIDLKDNFSL